MPEKINFTDKLVDLARETLCTIKDGCGDNYRLVYAVIDEIKSQYTIEQQARHTPNNQLI